MRRQALVIYTVLFYVWNSRHDSVVFVGKPMLKRGVIERNGGS